MSFVAGDLEDGGGLEGGDDDGRRVGDRVAESQTSQRAVSPTQRYPRVRQTQRVRATFFL